MSGHSLRNSYDGRELLRAGLAPLADGNTTSASIFERADFLPEKAPVVLMLKDVRQTEDGSVWLRYLIKES